MPQPITLPACALPPCQELLKAVEQFNDADWFECHETLEDLWVGSTGELRDFYQGVLMIAVSLHHWRDGNYKGSVLLLDKGSAHLCRVHPVCQGVDVDSLLAAAQRFKDTPVALGPDRMEELDHLLVPKVQVTTRHYPAHQ